MPNLSFPIAQVVWTDAAFFGSGSDSQPEPITCNSVGYLVFKDKKQVHLAMDISRFGPRDVLVVPTKYIKTVRIVEKASIVVQIGSVEVKGHAKRPSRKR